MDPEVLPATNIIKVGIQPAKNGWFTRQNSKFQLQKTGARRVRPFRMGKITSLNKDSLDASGDAAYTLISPVYFRRAFSMLGVKHVD